MTGSSPAVVVVLGGEGVLSVRAPGLVPAGAVVVAADSGLDAAVAAGITVHHVVGDLDSVDPGTLATAEAAGVTVHRHPADKDATDGELALDLAVQLVAADGALLVLGGGGGRLDHLLADLFALAAPRLAALDVTALVGAATATVVRPGRPRSLTGAPAEHVSLLPVHGPARGVTTDGLRWALLDADLTPGTTRAVSNELVGASATVAVAEGTLLVIQPGTHGAEIEPRATSYDPTPLDPSR